MARTAPVPNIPPIPGMCPSVAVMGGGGDGGGNGDDASGDGRSAGGCGQGGSGGCPNPVHGRGGSASAGDPVDVITGRVYTEPSVDLSLPGWMPFILARAYSSTARHRDVGLGRGWTHTFAWEIEQHRRTLTVWHPDGTRTESDIPPLDVAVVVQVGVLIRRTWGVQRVDHDGRSLAFQEVDDSKRRLRLTQIRDANANAIVLHYREGALDSLVDSAGRVIRARRHSDGRIAAFEVRNSVSQGSWIALRNYGYDSAGHLITTVDAAQEVMRHTYDDGLLTSCTYPSTLHVCYRYDSAGRCVATWAEQPEADPSLDESLGSYLDDRTTRSMGVRHCRIEYGDEGYREVVTSRGICRYFGNRFGKSDKVAWSRGLHANTYDDRGNVISYTHRSIERQLVLGSRRAGQGPLRDGSARRDHGNCVEVTEPNGAVVRYRYSYLGRPVAVIDERGLEDTLHLQRSAGANLDPPARRHRALIRLPMNVSGEYGTSKRSRGPYTGRRLDPDNPADHDEIRRCMDSITCIRSEDQGPKNSVRRAPCENCSQLLANLHDRWGAPNPGAIRRGVSETTTNSDGRLVGVGPHRNFTPPSPDYRPRDGRPVYQGYDT